MSRRIAIWNSAFSEYTSTITLWLQSTGLNASSSPAVTPAARHTPFAQGASPSPAAASAPRPPAKHPSTSAPLRHTSSASSPHANAPLTALASPTPQAGFGCPLYCTQWNTHWKNHVSSVQIGYPGGCGTPSQSLATASSPLSSSVTVGASVKKYTAPATSDATQNAHQSTFRKNAPFGAHPSPARPASRFTRSICNSVSFVTSIVMSKTSFRAPSRDASPPFPTSALRFHAFSRTGLRPLSPSPSTHRFARFCRCSASPARCRAPSSTASARRVASTLPSPAATHRL